MLRNAAALLVFAVPVVSQEQTRWREHLVLTVDCAGPATWRSAFRPTNLGGMLASEEGERLWRPLVAPMDELWRQWDAGGDFDKARRRVLDYSGTLRIRGFGHPREDQPLVVSMMFVLSPDGETDMAALAEDIARPMRRYAGERLQELEVGGRSLEAFEADPGEHFTVPTVLDGSIVMFFTEDMAMREALAFDLKAWSEGAGREELPANLPPFRMRIDLARMFDLDRDWQDEPILTDMLGVRSLGALTAACGPAGPHAQVDLGLEFREGERGIWKALFPAVQGLPGLIGRVPPEATPWLAVPMRFDQLYRTLLLGMDAWRDGGIEEARNGMHEEFGFHLDTEFLDHLGGEVLILGDLWNTGDPDEFREGGDPPLGVCIAFSVKDTAAFSAGFDKLLKHLKGTVHKFETREVEGVEITRLGVAFLTGFHVALGEGIFAVAFGEEGVAQLEALVRPGAAADNPLQQPVARVRGMAPEGWNGAGLVDLRAVLGGQVTLVLEAIEDSLAGQMGLEFQPEDVQDFLDGFLPLVERHSLTHVVGATGHTGTEWRLRLLW